MGRWGGVGGVGGVGRVGRWGEIHLPINLLYYRYGAVNISPSCPQI
ncbi:hypothetical protein BJP36_39655 [Moorena producens JHB]|uniref:Uncharacterized protein n=1 Tax=Moorena producens (strain JHB) TaxID=1454205 RepID=A0A9Q9SV38_MOOP1|nr:hypothetical protein [Moorena producens]WAN70170.1 hypothetical protein BJP36_39655 [Moorena producens JHB]